MAVGEHDQPSKGELYERIKHGTTRKVIEIGGNSLGVTLDKAELRDAGVERGDEVAIDPNPDGPHDVGIIFPDE